MCKASKRNRNANKMHFIVNIQREKESRMTSRSRSEDISRGRHALTSKPRLTPRLGLCPKHVALDWYLPIWNSRSFLILIISLPSTKFVFFGPIEKTRWPPWPLIGWDIFDFSSETAEQNSTKLDRKQDLNVLYQVCVFRADRKKQDGRPGLWLAETFSTSPLKPLNGIQRNLTGSKISTSSTKFVFFGPIGKTRWLPLPLIGWDIFDFCSETAERNSTKLHRKQDLNVLYLVCVFRADRKNKMAALPSDWLRHFRLLF